MFAISNIVYLVFLVKGGLSASFGERQSPINIVSCTDRQYTPALTFNNYNFPDNAPFKLKNNGWGVLSYTGKQPTISGGPLPAKETYILGAMHIHWGATVLGSDHAVNCKYAAAEMHIVHYKSSYGSFANALNYPDGLAGIGIMFSVSETDNPLLESFIKAHSSIAAFGSETTIASSSNPLNWASFFDNVSGFVTYEGSLSTIPYNEAITWIILNEVSTISKAQLEMLRSITGSDGKKVTEFTRHAQLPNGRTVYCSNSIDNTRNKKNPGPNKGNFWNIIE